MICIDTKRATRRRRRGQDAPSPQQIRAMTAEIQKGWSSAERARRAVNGNRRVELMIVSLFALSDCRPSDDA